MHYFFIAPSLERFIEWMGYFLLRESMLDSLVRARDTFLKPKTGLMMPSHATMLLAPISDEDERRVSHNDYANAMDDWREFAEVTSTMYGVDMSVLEQDYDREQREYYVMSSRWAELRTGCLLADPIVVKEYDMHTCTVEDARGVGLDIGEDKGNGSPIDFDVVGRRLSTSLVSADGDATADFGAVGPISGFAGWFTVDFKSRTDPVGRRAAPVVSNPAHLSTGPEMGCEYSDVCFSSLTVHELFLCPDLGHTPLSTILLLLLLKTPTGASKCFTYLAPSPSFPIRPHVLWAPWR